MFAILAIFAIVAIVLVASSQAVAQITGGELDTSLQPAQNPAGSYSPQIVAFANAIAIAEGSNPVYNNPGDIRVAGWTGLTFGAGLPQFSSQDEGWNRLYFQLQLIVNGQSAYYSLSDTIDSMSTKYTIGLNKTPTVASQNWARTVAAQLGVPSSTQLGTVLS